VHNSLLKELYRNATLSSVFGASKLEFKTKQQSLLVIVRRIPSQNGTSFRYIVAVCSGIDDRMPNVCESVGLSVFLVKCAGNCICPMLLACVACAKREVPSAKR